MPPLASRRSALPTRTRRALAAALVATLIGSLLTVFAPAAALADDSTARVYGTVTSAEGGAPIAGASVNLYFHGESEWFPPSQLTDINGQFSFDDIVDLGQYALVINHDSFVSFEEVLEIDELDLQIERNVVLTPGFIISGTVTVQGTGLPVPEGTEVNAVASEGWDGWAAGFTDEFGYYRIPSLLPQPWVLSAGQLQAGFQRFETHIDLTADLELDFELVPAVMDATITGFVFDAATLEPLDDVAVGISTGQTTTTGADGRYFFDGLAGTEYGLSFDKDGYQQAWSTVVLGESEEFVNAPVNMEALDSRISGVVTDHDGHPVAGIMVSASRVVEGPEVFPGGEAETQADGSYVMDVAAGNYTVVAGGGDSGWTQQTVQGVVVSKTSPRDDVDFILTPRVTGTVTVEYHDPHGLLDVDISLSLEPVGEGDERSGVANYEPGLGINTDVPVGTYRAKVIEPGSPGLSYAEDYVRDPSLPADQVGVGHDPAGAMLFTVAEGETTHIDVELTRGAQVFVKYLLQAGSELVSWTKVPISTIYQQTVDGAGWVEVLAGNSHATPPGGYLLNRLHPEGKYVIGQVGESHARSYKTVFWAGSDWAGVEDRDDAFVIDLADEANPSPVPVNIALEYKRPESAPVAVTDLDSELDGAISADADVTLGEPVSVNMGEELAGEWVSLWAHSTPTLLVDGDGWVQVDADGTATVTVPTSLDEGSHSLVAQLADGSLHGWTTFEASAPSGAAVTGDAIVGQRVVAEVGTDWAPHPTSFAYQWYADGKKIAKATKSSYVVGTSLVGKSLSVLITGKGPGKTKQTVTVSHPDVVVAGSFAATPTPTITGSAVVGKTLKVKAGSWSPKAKFSYQWFADGVALAKATKSSLKLTSAHLGAQLTVEVTGAAKGYQGDTATSASTDAVQGVLAKVPTPKVSGKARVGSTLTANPGAVAGATASVQWYTVSGTKNTRTAIAGATEPQFTVTAAERGKKLSVTVTWTRDGYVSVSKNSKASAKAGYGAAITLPKPVIAGDAVITRPESSLVYPTLEAVQDAAQPASAVITHQWLRDGKAIAGATGDQYTPSYWDVGRKISVKATATLPGHKTVTSTSASVKVTMDAAPYGLFSVAGFASVGQQLTLVGEGRWMVIGDPSTLLVPTTVSMQWYLNGKKVSKATGAAWVIPGNAVDGDVTVKVTANLTTEAGAKAGKQTQTIAFPSQIDASHFVFDNTKSAVISGEATVGKTLKVTVPKDRWSPAPSKYTYQWMYWDSGWQPISKATKSSYKLTAADVGRDLMVRIQAQRTGYIAGILESPTVTDIQERLLKVPTPKVTGTPKVGHTLTAAPGTLAGANPNYQWHTVKGKTRTDIVGANSASYTLTASERGTKIGVSVTWTKPGFTSVTKNSAATKKSVANGTITLPGPLSLHGTATLGSTLSVSTTTLPAEATITVNWKADGIVTATGTTLSLTGAHLGKKVTVTVTISHPGYTTITKTLTAGTVTP